MWNHKVRGEYENKPDCTDYYDQKSFQVHNHILHNFRCSHFAVWQASKYHLTSCQVLSSMFSSTLCCCICNASQCLEHFVHSLHTQYSSQIPTQKNFGGMLSGDPCGQAMRLPLSVLSPGNV
jgi:hypothetical protein